MRPLKYDRIVKFKISAETDSPLHMGNSFCDDEEVLTDPYTGVPFIQASSLAGMLRDISNRINGSEMTSILFGYTKDEDTPDEMCGNSRVRVTDGVMVASTVKLETRPNVSVDRKTGTVSSQNGKGQKFDLTYVSEGAIFSFFLYLYTSMEDKNDLEKKIQKTLGALNGGQARLGAKKSSGAGKFAVKMIEAVSYDLTEANGRACWIYEDSKETGYRDVTGECVGSDTILKYSVEIQARSTGPIQVKGLAMSEFGKDAPDSENYINSGGDYIVPGTSVRGVIRSQMEKIAAYQNRESLIKSAFGCIGENHNDGYSGNLVFGDCVIGNCEDNDKNSVRNRIHIDKFTGGVINSAFFKEKNASGKINIGIEILDKNNPEACLGLLIYALRDLAIKSFNIGNGYATGKGFLDVSKIVIKSGDDKAELFFGNDKKVVDDSKVISNAISALREVSN